MFIAQVLLCLLILSEAHGTSSYGCLQSPEVCDAVTQLCVDDGFIGKCIPKQQTWLSASQGDDVIDEPYIFPNENLHLTAEQRQRLTFLLFKTKKYLRSQNLAFSDLSEPELDRVASAIAQVFLLQEKEQRDKERLKLESYLRAIGRSDLARLLHGNRLEEIEAILNTSDPTRGNLHSNKSGGSKQVDGDESDSSHRKPTGLVEEKSVLRQHDPPAVLRDDVAPVQTELKSAETTQIDAGRTSENPNNALFDEIQNETAAVEFAEKKPAVHHSSKEATYIIVIVVLTVVVLCIVIIAVVVYCMKSAEARNKLLGTSNAQSGEDYQALCRQHYASKANEKPEAKQPLIPKTNITTSGRLFSPISHHHPLYNKGSRNSSQSSWSEEPITTTLDISTGHTVLAYMEDHLNNKDRLDQEWEALCAYKADNVTMRSAEENSGRNRSQSAVPYDHNRVKLNIPQSLTDNDYINASYIIDNDPRWPVYIAAQGPLSSTVHHFWQMIWEQGCVVIVMLTPLMEGGSAQCARYWPDEGSSTYNDYEIHLVSEHIWCEDYLVRSLYLKNLRSGETRTVTQFHFLSWPAEGVPPSTKQLLELRRKVSKCYRGNALSPIVVHCSDGCGRTGSYMLLDLVIARMVKGTCKEIDIAATLEHLRDQRGGRTVATKDQLEFVLACVADEVNAILKVLLQ